MSKFFEIDCESVEKILRHFYVDDLNCGVNSVEDGVNFYEKLKSILLEAENVVQIVLDYVKPFMKKKKKQKESPFVKNFLLMIVQ